MGITRIILTTAAVGSLPVRHSQTLPDKNVMVMFAEGQWDQGGYVSFHSLLLVIMDIYIYIYTLIYHLFNNE